MSGDEMDARMEFVDPLVGSTDFLCAVGDPWDCPCGYFSYTATVLPSGASVQVECPHCATSAAFVVMEAS